MFNLSIFGQKPSESGRFDGPEFQLLRDELRLQGGRYVGSQRAVAGLTGLTRRTLEKGLGVAASGGETASEALQRKGSGVAACGGPEEEPTSKLQKFLVGRGIQLWRIRKEWLEGAVTDTHIAALITYAATQSKSQPEEAKRWSQLISSVGLRTLLHELTGHMELLEREESRAKGVVRTKAHSDLTAQRGRNIAVSKRNVVLAATEKTPKAWRKVIKQERELTCHESNVRPRDWMDSKSLDVIAIAEFIDMNMASGSSGPIKEMRNLFKKNGIWNGVEIREKPVTSQQVKPRTERIEAEQGSLDVCKP